MQRMHVVQVVWDQRSQCTQPDRRKAQSHERQPNRTPQIAEEKVRALAKLEANKVAAELRMKDNAARLKARERAIVKQKAEDEELMRKTLEAAEKAVS